MVRERLLSALHGDASDVDIAPLGTPGQPESSDMVLAGRFPDNEAEVVERLISDAGGEVVANVDEALTRPRPRTHSNPWRTGFTRERLLA